MHPFTCPRCGSVSHSRHDALEGYCGRCHDWTGRSPRYAPGGPVSPAERVLTPDVLLTSGLFTYEGTEDNGRTTVWGYDPLRGPWVSSWRPDASMGAFTAEWTVNRLRLKVSAGVMARAVMERFPGGNVGDSWSWEELARLLPGAALLYVCPQCDTEFTVPPEHGEPVLCGAHSPAVRMIGPGTIIADLAASGPLTWDRADSDPLADIREARRLIEAAGAGAFDLAGRQVDVPVTADQAVLEALEHEILRGSQPPGTPAWMADAIAVWESCKDQARRERTLAELAQDAADAEWQIRPSERGTDGDGSAASGGTAARWSPEDPGDVIL